jgi:hypothetical protein
LVADVSGFEELMRVRIAVAASQAWREIQRPILEDWLNLKGKEFDHFVGEVCGWKINGSTVKLPLNKENEAKATVIRENVKFDRKSRPTSCRAIADSKLQSSRESSGEHMKNQHEHCSIGKKFHLISTTV